MKMCGDPERVCAEATYLLFPLNNGECLGKTLEMSPI